jgi:hypothetical protein
MQMFKCLMLGWHVVRVHDMEDHLGLSTQNQHCVLLNALRQSN